MNKVGLLLVFIFFTQTSFGQVSGNINYQNQTRLIDRNIDVQFTSNNEIIFDVKGLSNVKADAYVAILNVSQIGKTAEEVNSLMNERIGSVRTALKSKKPDMEFFVDMISFVPIYEFESEKKLFSKKTYNEIPKGFELKKNLHIRYTDPLALEEIMSLCSKSEIYDLVRVDYVLENIEKEKKELVVKVKEIVKEKLNTYQDLLGVDLSSLDKEIVDGFKIFYPVEKYRSYQAFSNSSLDLKKPAKVNSASKSTTQHYFPVMNKEFDFVINPVIVEPVVQILYQVKMRVKFEVEPLTQKEYYIISPSGEMKKLKVEQQGQN